MEGDLLADLVGPEAKCPAADVMHDRRGQPSEDGRLVALRRRKRRVDDIVAVSTRRRRLFIGSIRSVVRHVVLVRKRGLASWT